MPAPCMTNIALGRLLTVISEKPGIWSNRDLGAEIQKSEASIQRYLKILKSRGEIHVETRRYKIGKQWINNRFLSINRG